jgi:ABC-type multidrug transport system fused ATPase/permease subunit
MSVVFQESFLFNDSIRENIRVGKPTAVDAEIERAARAAEIHESILAMPGQYGAIVGERGGKLSGGQRQGIAIARAVIKDPAILLLDEATSALDPATEELINGTLSRLSAGRTVISVTHRLASITDADCNFRFLIGTHGRIWPPRRIGAARWTVCATVGETGWLFVCRRWIKCVGRSRSASRNSSACGP